MNIDNKRYSPDIAPNGVFHDQVLWVGFSDSGYDTRSLKTALRIAAIRVKAVTDHLAAIDHLIGVNRNN